MDRRLFLTGLLGLAGTAAAATVIGPERAQAGIPNPGPTPGAGILDELDAAAPEVMDVDHRRGHRSDHRRRRERGRHGRRGPRHGHRRRVWRRVCRRVRVHGRWRQHCRRERVWIWT